MALTACNGNNTSPATTDSTAADTPPTPKEPARSKLNEEGTQKVLAMITTYYSLKNALVATKGDDASKAAAQLAVVADSLQQYLKHDSVNGAALKVYADTIITESKTAAATTDPTCQKQRASFDHISSAMYSMLKLAELKNAGVYHEFCPMAFNDKGAYWLSDESEIKNPYFGKKMMECGEVTDSL